MNNLIKIVKNANGIVRNKIHSFVNPFQPVSAGVVDGATSVADTKHEHEVEVLNFKFGTEIKSTEVRDRTKEYSAFTATNCSKIASVKGDVGRLESVILGICESTTTPGDIAISHSFKDRIQEHSLDGSKPPRVVAQFKDISTPTGIAPCGDGTADYIVVLGSNHQVTRISGVDGSEMWTVGSTGSGLVVLPNEQVVVADCQNDRLQVLHIKTGKIIRQLGVGSLSRPIGLAFDRTTGLLYISECGAHRIAVMDPTTDKIVWTIGDGEGSALGELNQPYGIALDGFGNLLVFDKGNNKVVVFNAGNGTPITTFPTPPKTFSLFVNANGNVVVGGTEFIKMW